MRSRPVHSRRSATRAALLILGILGMLLGLLSGMLAPHLAADPAAPQPAGFGTRRHEASAHARHEQYLANRRGSAFGIPLDAYANAVAAMRTIEARAIEHRGSRADAVPAATSTPHWTALGPVPITNQIPIFGTDPIGGPLASATGKVTAIAADPTTSGRLFIGTSGGGVWMSTNGGTSFTPIFDTQATLAIGAIALDPTTNPPTLYVGTGEGNNTVDRTSGWGCTYRRTSGIHGCRIPGAGVSPTFRFRELRLIPARRRGSSSRRYRQGRAAIGRATTS